MFLSGIIKLSLFCLCLFLWTGGSLCFLSLNLRVFRHPRLLEFPATFGDLAETQDYDPPVGNWKSKW